MNESKKEFAIEKADVVVVNGHQVEVTIQVEVEEDWSIAQEDVDSRGFFPANIFVFATPTDSELWSYVGEDQLGGVELRPNNHFDSRAFNQSLAEVLKDHAMIENAKADFAQKLGDAYAELATRARVVEKYAKAEPVEKRSAKRKENVS